MNKKLNFLKKGTIKAAISVTFFMFLLLLFTKDDCQDFFFSFSIYILIICYIFIYFYDRTSLWMKKLNSKQKIIIATLVPIIFYITVVLFIPEIYSDFFDRRVSVSITDFKYTWNYLVVFLLMIGFFEYKLFDSDNNEK